MKEAEDIIISKRFFELTPSELEAVKEFAANEEDYEAMRWFLQSTKTSFAEAKIEPSSDLRKNVFAHLAQQKPTQTIWLNGVGAFLFPTQKKFYQYPAFQLAAAAVVLIGFVVIYDKSVSENTQELAINNTEQIVTDGKTSLKEGEIATGETDDVVPTDLTKESPVAGKDVIAQKGPTTENTPDDVVIEDVRGYNGVGNGNYALMSVAEESRLISNEKLLLDEQKEFGNLSANSYRVDEVKIVNGLESDKFSKTDDDNDLSDELKKETGKKDRPGRNESDAKNVVVDGTIATTATGGTASSNTATSPTTTVVSPDVVVVNSEKANDEGGRYNTATAGGNYGGTVPETESTVSTKLEVEVPAKEFSIAETKELRALFFTVK